MNCPQCNRILSAFKTYTHHAENGHASERLEYTCTFDGTNVVVDDPELQAAHLATTELYEKHSSTLQADLIARKDLLEELHSETSGGDKTEAKAKLRAVDKRLESFKKFLTQNKNFLRNNLNEATEKLTWLEAGEQSELAKVEMTGLRIYVESQKRELLRVEALLSAFD